MFSVSAETEFPHIQLAPLDGYSADLLHGQVAESSLDQLVLHSVHRANMTPSKKDNNDNVLDSLSYSRQSKYKKRNKKAEKIKAKERKKKKGKIKRRISRWFTLSRNVERLISISPGIYSAILTLADEA